MDKNNVRSLNDQEEVNIKQSDINLESSSQNKNPFQKIPENKNKKLVKFDTNNVTTIPLTETYNLRYSSNATTFNDLERNIKDILFDPKYSDKRSKSTYSKKSFREKFESMKLKVPEIKKWNCDPTAEVIIHNLELKIDILSRENFLLTKKIKELVKNNKNLQLNLSQNILIQKTDQFKDKDIDFYKQINKLKDENYKLKNSNENLVENNMELKKIIEELKKEIKLNHIKYEDEINNNKIYYQKKLSEQIDKNNELTNIINNNNYNNRMDNNKNINNDNDKDNDNDNDNVNYNNEENIIHNNNDSGFDLNKYLMNEELQYKKLLEENEQLHKQLRILLSIDDDDINKLSLSSPDFMNNQKLIYTPIKENTLQFNSINKNNNNINNNNQEDLINENYMLKQKIKSLNNELNKVTYENNQKLLKIQQKLNENELKNKIEKEKEFIKSSYNKDNINNKDEELDKILNDTLLNINPEDEESKKMMSTIENMKNNDKKRISQCLIINNKIKSLSEENNLLHSQLLSLQKRNNQNDINNINNINNLNTLNTLNDLNNNLNNLNNNVNNPHFCFCKYGNNESYDYLINALKIKDDIIIKYKEKNDDNENKYKALIIENAKLKELKERRKKNNDYNNIENNNIEKDNKMKSMRRERAEGLEDYLLGKIVNNQKEVLGERAPRFEHNYKYMSNSMQVPDNNNPMNNRYNNYHYKGTRMTEY